MESERKEGGVSGVLDTFNGGYTKALIDVKNYFEGHTDILSWNHMWNRKGVLQVLNALIEHREELRETGDANLVMNRETRTVH